MIIAAAACMLLLISMWSLPVLLSIREAATALKSRQLLRRWSERQLFAVLLGVLLVGVAAGYRCPEIPYYLGAAILIAFPLTCVAVFVGLVIGVGHALAGDPGSRRLRQVRRRWADAQFERVPCVMDEPNGPTSS